jgi:hypothetical protein
MKLKDVLGMLKGKDVYGTAENFSILLICIGALMLSSGIGLAIFNPQGFATILAMTGAFLAFVSVVALIFVWLAKDLFGD